MSENEHRNCLFCGDLHPNSFGLRFTPDEEGNVCATFQGYDELQGYDGILHGGIIASLLDAAMTHCLFHKSVRALTAAMQIRYKHAVPCNAELNLQACLVDSHPPLYRMKARILHDGLVMAHAEARFMQTGKEAALS